MPHLISMRDTTMPRLIEGHTSSLFANQPMRAIRFRGCRVDELQRLIERQKLIKCHTSSLVVHQPVIARLICRWEVPQHDDVLLQCVAVCCSVLLCVAVCCITDMGVITAFALSFGTRARYVIVCMSFCFLTASFPP